MSEYHDIQKIIEDHERRISALEGKLPPHKPKTVITKNGNKSLPDHIIDLRDKSFFSKPKTSEEVHAEINKIYPCELNRVSVALIRLSAKKALRLINKHIENKKYKAYVW